MQGSRPFEAYIYYLSNKYACTRVEAEDLAQEGRIAAWRAEKRYRPNGGSSLLTWKTKAARFAMIRYVQQHAYLIRLPITNYWDKHKAVDLVQQVIRLEQSDVVLFLPT